MSNNLSRGYISQILVIVSQGTNLLFLLLHFTIWYLLSAEEELGLIGIFYGQYMSEIADWLK